MSDVSQNNSSFGRLMGNGFDFAGKNAVCTETHKNYSYNAMKGACKDSSCTVGVEQVSRDTRTCPPTARRHEADARKKTPLMFDDFCKTARRSNKGKRRENRSLDDVCELDDARQSMVLQGRTLEGA